MADEKIKFKSRAIIEILGKPKEHVEKTLKKYTEEIKEDKNITFLKEDFAEAKEQDEGMFSAFSEIEFETDELNKITGFCFDYMPSSVDIFEPEKVTYRAGELNIVINDLLGKLHHVDMAVKKLNNENQFLKNNTNVLIKNMIKIGLFNRQLTQEQVAKVTGINKDEIKPFLDALIKEEYIELVDDKYILKERKKDGEPEAQN